MPFDNNSTIWYAVKKGKSTKEYIVRLLLRIICFNVILAFIASPCLAENPPSPAMPGDIQAIQKSGLLRVGVIESMSPPFVFERNGHLEGYDVDLCRRMGKALDVRPEFIKIPGGYEGLVDAVASGKADIGMSELSKTASRSQKVFFSHIYFTSQIVLVANRLTMARRQFAWNDKVDTQEVVRYFNRPEIRISTMENSSFVLLAKQLFPKARLVLTSSWADTALKVYDGAVDVGLMAGSAYKIAVHSNPELLYKMSEIPLRIDDPLAIAVWPGRPDLVRWINDYLEAYVMGRQTSTDDLITTYLGNASPAPPRTDQDGTPEKAEASNRSGLAAFLGVHVIVLGLVWWAVRKSTKSQWLLSPWTVLAAILLGGVAGFNYPSSAEFFSRPAALYMGFWRMCVIPIMLTAIITSIYRLLAGENNKVLVKRMVVIMPILLLATTLLSVWIGAVGRPGANFSQEAQKKLIATVDTDMVRSHAGHDIFDNIMNMADSIVPDNVLVPVVNNQNLAVLFVAVFFGVAIALGEKKGKTTIIEAMDAILEAFTTMVHISLYLLPFALYALTFDFMARAGVELLSGIARLLACLILAMAPGVLFALFLLRLRLRIPFGVIFKEFGLIFLLSFSARSSVISMPLGLETLNKSDQINKTQASAAFPFALLVCHSTYAVFFALTPVFVGQAFRVDFTLWQYLAIACLAILSTVAATGSIGMSYVLLLSIVCGPLGLPPEPAILVGMAAVSLLGPLMAGIQALFGCGVTTLVVESQTSGEAPAS